jgi:acyl carrier protein
MIIQRPTAMEGDFPIGDIRKLIAEHLCVAVEHVRDETHFSNDLGADWLDRLELMMAIEDQFTDLEIGDDQVDQVEVVADLIRRVESAWRKL